MGCMYVCVCAHQREHQLEIEIHSILGCNDWAACCSCFDQLWSLASLDVINVEQIYWFFESHSKCSEKKSEKSRETNSRNINIATAVMGNKEQNEIHGKQSSKAYRNDFLNKQTNKQKAIDIDDCRSQKVISNLVTFLNISVLLLSQLKQSLQSNWAGYMLLLVQKPMTVCLFVAFYFSSFSLSRSYLTLDIPIECIAKLKLFFLTFFPCTSFSAFISHTNRNQ